MSAYRLLFVFDLFEWDGFFKNRIKARLIIEDVPICKISQGLLLLRSDKHFSKSWQLKTCSYEALAVFSLKFVILNHFQEQMQRTQRENCKIKLHSFVHELNLNTSVENVTKIYTSKVTVLPNFILHVFYGEEQLIEITLSVSFLCTITGELPLWIFDAEATWMLSLGLR